MSRRGKMPKPLGWHGVGLPACLVLLAGLAGLPSAVAAISSAVPAQTTARSSAAQAATPARPRRTAPEVVPAGARESSAHEADRLRAGFLTRGLCSALWVNHRDRDDFLAHDILLAAEGLARTDLEVDATARRVTGHLAGGGSVTAAFHPTHGCTLLPPGMDDVAFDTTPVRPARPVARDRRWPAGDGPRSPPPAGVDPAALEAAVRAFFVEDAARPIHTRAVVAVHDGALIAERYAPGFDRHSVMIGWSMGKSLTAALVGVAVRKGWLSLDEPAPLAEWQREGDPRARIRIRDLMQMSSGLDFKRLALDDPAFFSAANHHFQGYLAPVDVFALATGRPVEFAPQQVGRYRNGDPLSLGRILREAVEKHGMNYLAFPQRELFDPIGATSMVLERDYQGNMILTGLDHGTPRDWARFGLLHAQDGIWNGRRLLPAGWVRFVSSPAPAWPESNYGGLFWLNRSGALPGAPRDAYYAAGAFGQFVIIVPSEHLVVVRMGYSAESKATRQSVGAGLVRLIAVLHPTPPRSGPDGEVE
ncbi:MAG: serine hydrolase domain-containing protein [Acidobacteriota bacterium]